MSIEETRSSISPFYEIKKNEDITENRIKCRDAEWRESYCRNAHERGREAELK